MKLNLELIDRLFGKSGRSIQRMLESDQLTQGELLDFSLFVASLTVATGGILGKPLMDSIKWGLRERLISGLNPSLLGLHISHTKGEEMVSVSAKRKARSVSLNGDEVLELAYLMAIADEHFFEQLRGRVETDLRERVWSQEELVAQLTHKRQHWLDEDGTDEPQPPLH
ncbi:hypothetical protein GL264_05795 [Aeromonas jandaei]|uniref:hypothetical protein n=1 Tax=Aeromonas jandaei TaxID=650 RepID=UPI001C5B65FE|nr:hypothetical protein [Aeromonas jandaei]MBW3760323.1 hypothetical protein [Aeromonas jandaei]